MTETTGFMKHWTGIEPERLERYEAMYAWNPASEHLYAPAGIAEGHAVADFGCGPGHAALEFAKWVGPSGHVHALDVNADFAARARDNAERAGIAERVTAHLLEDQYLPLPDDSPDRVVARNTLIYVEDPLVTFEEFRRVLRSGGLAHVIEGDWSLMAVESRCPPPNGAVSSRPRAGLGGARKWAASCTVSPGVRDSGTCRSRSLPRRTRKGASAA